MDEASDGEQLEDSLISTEKAAKSKRGTRSEREDQLKKLLDDDDDGKAHPSSLCSVIQRNRMINNNCNKQTTKKKPTTPPPPETKTPLPSHLPAKPANNQRIPLLLQRHVAAEGEEGARS